MRAITLSILLAQSLSFTIAAAQDTDKADALSRFVADALQRTHTPGAAVTVAYHGEIAFSQAIGSASVESGLPLTHDTLFRVGAPSAVVTSLSALSLAAEGKLDLDGPIARYVPALIPDFGRMTTRQLLNHWAGFKSDHMARPLYESKDLKDEIMSWKSDRILTAPGRIYSQSNPGVSLAGLVLEEIEGKPFAEIAATRVLSPLGMKTASFRFIDSASHPLTQGHTVRGDQATVVRPFAEGSLGWPSGSLFASVEDLSKFALALANEGTIPGERGLPKTVLHGLLAPELENPYSFTSSRFRGVRQWAIAGGWAGLTNAVRVAPEQGFAAIVISNASNSVTEEIIQKAMELYLPLEPRTQARPVSPVRVPDAERDRMTGIFENETRIEIQIDADKLVLKSDGTTSEIQKSGDGQYVALIPALRGPARTTRFSVVAGPDGRAEFLIMGSRAWVRK